MALVPSKSEGKEKLNSLGISGHVFPLGEALGLSRLPFKMTIAAMLEAAYEARKGGGRRRVSALWRPRRRLRRVFYQLLENMRKIPKP
jgi:hypothetical protein